MLAELPAAVAGLFNRPAVLLLLPLVLLPWWRRGEPALAWSDLGGWPADPLGRGLDLARRGLASLALLALLLSLGDPEDAGQAVERIGQGAHLSLVLDRSASMVDSFSGGATAGGEESKAEAASRLLDRFVAGRPDDLFALTLFSTAPIKVLGLSADHAAVRAAIQAAATPGVGLTHIAAGLSRGLDTFRDQPLTGSRVLMLVSDGAASIDPRAQVQIRRLFHEHRAQLCWIFLRTPEGRSPTTPPPEGSGPEVAPEYLLDVYFRDLGVPYRLYEADSPQALAQAIEDVAALQNLPLQRTERPERQPLSPWFDALALAGLLMLALARAAEIETWTS